MKVSIFKAGSSIAGAPTSPRPRTGRQSIRGKISGPIPIPSPADDEFPIRNLGAGIANSTEPEIQEKPTQPPPPPPLPPQQAPPTVPVPPAPAPATPQDTTQTASPEAANETSPHDTTQEPVSSFRESPSGGPRNITQVKRRTNAASTVRNSYVSQGTENTGSSKAKPQRKKSTLRGAFSKLFGRKKKTGSVDESQRISAIDNRQSQYQSDPPPMIRERKESESKRSASLPITEYDRALRSHSIGLNDMNAIESARNSMYADFSTPGRRRATTTTSQLFRGREGEFGGLSPRPASTHVRSSRVFATPENPDEIGRAITSDSVGQKRRSRSLSGLDDTEGRAGLLRRSDEIRFWRQSHDPTVMSPISSNMEDEHDRGTTSMDFPSPPQEADRGGRSPPQPFDFGNLTHLNATAGMKITKAVSLETRIDELEVSMRWVEKTVTQLCEAAPGFHGQIKQRTAVAGGVAQEHGSVRRSGSTYSRESHTSFGDARTYIGSTQLSAPSVAQRPNSDSTIRGAVSLPTIPRSVHGSAAGEQQSLLALLEEERAARQALQAQVTRLSSRLETLLAQRDAHVLQPPPTARSFGQLSAFDQDDTDDERMHGMHGSRQMHLAFEDSGVATGSTTGGEDDYSETFETPREERQHGYSGFGDVPEEAEEDEDELKRKKAARTMSLGQLTLGKSHAKVAA